MIYHKSYRPNFFEKLDFFGLRFEFFVDEYSRLKTKLGAIFTIFYVLITIGLFFGFGMDLIYRKRPKVSNNNKIVPYQKQVLSNSNFTFAFRVEDRTGKFIEDESLLSLEVTYFYYYIDQNGTWQAVFSDIHPFKRCRDLDKEKMQEIEQKYNISLASWNCIDFDNFTMGGNWDGNFVYGLLINTKQCQYSKNNTKCLKDKELKEKFQNDLTGSNYFYSYLYLEALPEMDDYEKPIKPHLVNKYEMLNLKVGKRTVQTYKLVSIDNDKGWFFSDVESKSFFSSDSMVMDFTLKEEFIQDVVYTHLIYLGNKVEFYNRSYTKIQEVIANIGGFAKIFHTFIKFVYLFIGKYLKNLFLNQKLDFEFENNQEITPLLKNVKNKLANLQKTENNNLSIKQSKPNISRCLDNSKSNLNSYNKNNFAQENVSVSKVITKKNNKFQPNKKFEESCDNYFILKNNNSKVKNFSSIKDLKETSNFKNIINLNDNYENNIFTRLNNNNILNNFNISQLYKDKSKKNSGAGISSKDVIIHNKTFSHKNKNAEGNKTSILKFMINDLFYPKNYLNKNMRADGKSKNDYINYKIYQKFFEKKFCIFSYLKSLLDLDMLKEILFEEFTILFDNMKAKINIQNKIFKDIENVNETSVKVKSLNVNKMDRIFANLFLKLDKDH